MGPDFTYIAENVQGEGIVKLSKSELFDLYGGERVPNYRESENSYDCAIIVFSSDNFLSENRLKAYHYGAQVLETEGSAEEYNSKYSEVYDYFQDNYTSEYNGRQLNPYHASYKNLHFKTLLFDDITTGIAAPETMLFLL